jgi:MoxR-like ATPase
VEEAVRQVLEPKQVIAMRKRLQDVFIEPTVERYAVELVAATRDPGRWRAEWQGRVLAGASPRGSIALLRAAMARAWLADRDYVLPEDVIALAPDVLRHRLVLDFSAQAEGLDASGIVAGLLEAVPGP